MILCFFLTVKKAYYRLSLQVHPDRVAEADKLNATQKFQVLTKLNGVLSDAEKKALYDEQGVIDDEDSNTETDWERLWKQYFKPISDADIENFKKEFIGEFNYIFVLHQLSCHLISVYKCVLLLHWSLGSETEERDIRKAYLNGKGCINYMFESVPFMTVEDEPRIMEVVKGNTSFILFPSMLIAQWPKRKFSFLIFRMDC